MQLRFTNPHILLTMIRRCFVGLLQVTRSLLSVWAVEISLARLNELRLGPSLHMLAHACTLAQHSTAQCHNTFPFFPRPFAQFYKVLAERDARKSSS